MRLAAARSAIRWAGTLPPDFGAAPEFAGEGRFGFDISTF
jgi:hypothetical protein